jgi:PST family polysaccharide transporter
VTRAANSAPGDPPQHEEAQRRLDTKIMRGSGWVAVGYGGRQLLTFGSMLALVRLVEPKAFGLVALATPFLLALQYLQESGLGAALIHRRRDVPEAASTVLVYSPLAGAALYGASFASAPLLARLLHAPGFSDVLRVLALLIVIRSLAVVPNALLERELKFAPRAVVELSAAVAQFGLSIALAVAGLGVWALVFGQLAGEGASTVLYWLLSPMRPSPRGASLRVLRELARYGRFVSAGNLLILLNNTADNLVIGRVLGETKLGYYAVASRLGTMPSSVIGYIVGRVMFSVYSALQHDVAAVRRVYLQNLQRVAIFAMPASVGLIVAARPVVLGLLGERWSPAILPLRLLALFGLSKTLMSPTGELLKGLGRPKVIAVLGAVYPVAAIPALLVLVPTIGLAGGPLAFLLGQLVAGVPAFVIGLRSVGLSARELATGLAAPVAPSVLLAVVMLVAVHLTSSAAPLVSLLVVVVLGLAAYVAGVVMFARGVVVPMWTSLRARGA